MSRILEQKEEGKVKLFPFFEKNQDSKFQKKLTE
jgi:hypothetical protein